MHKIPITQMEIIRDSSNLFTKDLPLNPYYKSLTSDIILANNSLKASEPENIEAFFKEFICEKNQDEEKNEGKNEDSDRDSEDHKDYDYDNDEEYDQDDGEEEYYEEHEESVFPTSNHSSRYENSKPSQPFKSKTSLQEMLDFKFNKEKELISMHSKASEKKKINKTQDEPDYYCFPQKYKNYKYAKVNQESLPADPKRTLEKKREMLLKNQKKIETSIQEAKNFASELSSYQSTEGVHRSLYDKALKTQQNMFLLPEEKKRQIKKNLKELILLEKNLSITKKRWVSPYAKQPQQLLPEIRESREFSHRTNTLRGWQHFYGLKKNFSNSLNLTSEKLAQSPKTLFGEKANLLTQSTDKKCLEIKGESKLPLIKNKAKKTSFDVDYKALYSEMETLKRLSFSKEKSLDTLIVRSPLKKPEQQKKSTSEEIETKVFLGFYKKAFQNKPFQIIDLLLKPFGIDINQPKFSLDFGKFVNFHRTLLFKGALSIDEEVNYLSQVFYKAKPSEKKSRLISILEGFGGCCLISGRLLNEFKSRMKIKFDLDERDPNEFLLRKDFEEGLRLDTEIKIFLMQIMRLKDQ